MASRKDIQAGVVEQVTTAPTAANDESMDFEFHARKSNQTLLIKDHKRKALAEVYRREPKRSVMVAPMYAPYFGKVMHIMINGVSVAVPCNGRPYDIPETFAGEAFRRINAINDQQRKAKRYSDVNANIEGAPGELALF